MVIFRSFIEDVHRVSIEAGGNTPFIVFDDADIDQAVEGDLASIHNNPRTCGSLISLWMYQVQFSASSVPLDKPVFARTASTSNPMYTPSLHPVSRSELQHLKSETALKRGCEFDSDSCAHQLTLCRLSTHGPLIHERAVEKVARHVNDAVQKGAQILIGGSRIDGPGTFFAPTVLCDVPSGTLINDEETFGPIAALTKFETEEEVIKLANDTKAGLAGYFYSRDVGRVWRVAEALEVGMVGANTVALSQAVIPFGGIKESGIGESTQVSDIVSSETFQVVRVVMELRST